MEHDLYSRLMEWLARAKRQNYCFDKTVLKKKQYVLQAGLGPINDARKAHGDFPEVQLYRCPLVLEQTIPLAYDTRTCYHANGGSLLRKLRQLGYNHCDNLLKPRQLRDVDIMLVPTPPTDYVGAHFWTPEEF